MKKSRLPCMATICIFVVSLTASANATTSESYPVDRQSVKFSGEHITRISQSVSAADLLSDEVLLIGSAIIGLVGITLMRRTLH